MSYGLGVDLGTSFTGAAVSRDGHLRMVTLSDPAILIPSVVRVAADGSLLAGDGGVRPEDGDPSRIGRDFKRRLGDPTPLILGGQPHSAVSLLAATLASVVRTVTALEGSAPDRVALTYPAVWGPYRREQFAEVPRRAGLDPELVTVTTEPEAAATHYASRQKLDAGDVIAVYDLGGGTFDTTVTKVTGTGMEILGIPEGVEWVGGVDFDEAILNHVDQAVGGAVSALDPRDPGAAIALQQIRDECVRAKEELSRAGSTEITVRLPHRQARVGLSRAEFENMIETPLESTVAALHRTMHSAGLKSGDLAGVLLVGGSSRIPLVSRMLSGDLGRPVLVDPDPQHCVALGAAAIAASSAGTGTAVPPGGAAAKADPAPASRSGGRHLRRRVVAATAGVALLVAGVALVARTSPPPDAHEQSSSRPDPTLIGAPDAATAPRPTATKPHPSATTAVETGALSLLKVPALPITSEVLGLGAKCMDVTNAIADDGTAIQIFGCNNTPAQSWILGRDGTFRSLGKCMSVGPSAGVGPQVQLETCDGGGAQKWQLRRGGSVLNVKSKKCLDVLGKSSADRTPLVMSGCAHVNSQIWSLPPAASSIKVRASSADPRRGATISGLGRRPQGVAFSPDGTRAYVPSTSANTLAVIDTSSGRILREIRMPTAPQYVTAAPDGRRLYVTLNATSARTNSVEVVDAVTGALLHRISIGRTPLSPAVSPDGLELYVPDRTASQVAVIDTALYVVKARIKVSKAPQAVAFTPDSLHAYVADQGSGKLTKIDVASGTVNTTFGVGSGPVAAAVSPDGQQVATANAGAGTVTLAGVTDDTVEGRITVGKNPQSLRYAPDGRHLYVVNAGSGSGSGTVSVIDVQTQRVTSTVTVGNRPVAVAVSPDGRRAYVTNSGSDTVSILDTVS